MPRFVARHALDSCSGSLAASRSRTRWSVNFGRLLVLSAFSTDVNLKKIAVSEVLLRLE